MVVAFVWTISGLSENWKLSLGSALVGYRGVLFGNCEPLAISKRIGRTKRDGDFRMNRSHSPLGPVSLKWAAGRFILRRGPQLPLRFQAPRVRLAVCDSRSTRARCHATRSAAAFEPE